MRAWLDRLPERAVIALGLLGYAALMSMGLIGALIVIGYELFVPTPTKETQ